MISEIITLFILFLVHVHGTDGKTMKMNLSYESVSPSQETPRLMTDHTQEGLAVFRDAMDRLVKVHIAENWQARRVSVTQESNPEWLSYLLSSSLAHKIFSARGNRGPWTTPPPQSPQPGYLPSFGQQFPTAFSTLLDAMRGTSSDDDINAGVREVGRERLLRPVRRRREDDGVMYLAVSGGGASACPSYADTVAASLTQMAFASMAITVFNAVANIVNNINNNNHNNNVNSNSNVVSNNANVASNSNNGNQVTVVLPPPIPGRRRRDVHVAKRVEETLRKVLMARHRLQTSYVTREGPDERQLQGPAGVLHAEGVNVDGNKLNSLHQDWKSRSKVTPWDSNGCVSRKAYARAALATLHVLQDYIVSPDKNKRSKGTATSENTRLGESNKLTTLDQKRTTEPQAN